MRDDGKNEDGIRDDKTFNSGTFSVGTVFFILTDGMRDSFKIDGGMRDEKREIARSQALRGELRDNQNQTGSR